jgi:hypothetical protein
MLGYESFYGISIINTVALIKYIFLYLTSELALYEKFIEWFSNFSSINMAASTHMSSFKELLITNKDLAAWFTPIGTIILAIIAVFQDRIHDYLKSPKLDCTIEVKPPDCHKTTSIARPSGYNIYSFITYYYRFKIWNKGKTSAEKVEVILADIFEKRGSNWQRIESFPLDNLVWSILDDKGQRRIYLDYISPNTYKYCNLGHIHDPKFRSKIPGESNPDLNVGDYEPIFCFDVYFRSNILYYLVPPSIYRIILKVGCTNAKTISKEYELELNNYWSDNETMMLANGLSIKEL